MSASEWQFDGIVGPTHNYAGLALGNLAAARNKGMVSNPRNAALQGLEKMRFVRDLGMPQAFLPPHIRPVMSELRRLGFRGDVGTMLDTAFRVAPEVLAAVVSSSFMWAANAATVTLSDYEQGHLYITPANLGSHYHRSIEAKFQRHSLASIFHNKKLFTVHNHLPLAEIWGDEGAANYMAINTKDGKNRKHLFAYGKSYKETIYKTKYMPRQQREASEAIARLHQIKHEDCLFFRQSPEAMNAGVFHNDVIAMNTTTHMIIHEKAFIPEHQQQMRDFFAASSDFRLREVAASELSIDDAVSTYLFNSQMLALADGAFALVAPSECKNHAGVRELIDRLIAEGILTTVHYLDVRESMRNGGGPACLRLRIVLTPEQEEAMHQGVIMTDNTYAKLQDWVNRYYRDRLELRDFCDPQFINELNIAYHEFSLLIDMPNLYDGFRNE